MSSFFRIKSSSSAVTSVPIGLITFTVDTELPTVSGEGTDEGEEEGVVVMRVAAIRGFPLLPKVVVVVALFSEGRFVAVDVATIVAGAVLFCALDCRGLGPGLDRPFFEGCWVVELDRDEAPETVCLGMYSDLDICSPVLDVSEGDSSRKLVVSVGESLQ